VPRTAGEVRREVARIHVGDRGHHRRSERCQRRPHTAAAAHNFQRGQTSLDGGQGDVVRRRIAPATAKPIEIRVRTGGTRIQRLM